MNATVHMPTLTIAQRACTPFVQTVSLPSVDSAELPNIGSRGQPTDFRFTVRCPHNGAWFGYYVEAAHGYENEGQGIIKIDPASTAKGIGLQVSIRSNPDPVFTDYPNTTPNYQPIKFGSTNKYSGASVTLFNVTGNPLTDESDYTFPNVNSMPPLQVAVYRTGAIVPGSYTAGLKVYIVYR